MSEGELVLAKMKSGFTIEKLGTRVAFYFQTEEEAELLFIALSEADRKGSFVKIDFERKG